MNDQFFNNLIEDFSKLEEVEGILLSGSRATDQYDEHSDYDVYIYLNKYVDINIRKQITDIYCEHMELENTFWELEDDGILKNGVNIELIYRDFSIFDMVDEVCFKFKPSIGYTTCFWYNILYSKILYDKQGILTEKINKYHMDYPDQLRLNIINKNYPLLKSSITSYYEQIKKAVLRNDIISINHRITAFLASYFDIIFAINKCLHPGEKRLIQYVLNLCERIPEGFEKDIHNLLSTLSNNHELILPTLDIILDRLNELLIEEKLL